MTGRCDRSPDGEHDWRWVTRVIRVIGDGYGHGESHNVECAHCGERTWAHGKEPLWTRP